MQFRTFASIAMFAAGAMAASATSSASTAASTPVDLTAGVPSCGLSCIQSAVSASGCEATDSVCLCTTGSKAFLSAGTTCLLQSSDCSADDLQTIQNLAKSRCATLLGASAGASVSGSSTAKAAAVSGSSTAKAADVSGSSTAKAAAVSGSATSSGAVASATSTGGAMQVGASLMAVGAGALAFIL